MNVINVMFGGFFGAMSRYVIDIFIETAFPIATLLTNIIGSFLLGMLFASIYKTGRRHVIVHHLFGVGFLGSFTTFSTFAVDALLLFQIGHIVQAAFYIIGTTVLSILFAYIGVKMMTKKVRNT